MSGTERDGMKPRPADMETGTRSRELGSEAVRAMWGECDLMNAGLPGPGRFVPVRALVVDDAMSPRQVDEDTVAAYADNAQRLPPVLVQRETLVLVDGRHRLHAVIRASRDYILVVEEDIPDDDLRDWAIRANVGHGKPYTLAERRDHALDMMARHPLWSVQKVAEWSGMSVRWLWEQKARKEQRESEREDQPVQNAQADRRIVEGRDGKTYHQPPPAANRNTAPVRSYDPGPEREQDDNDEWDAADVPEPDEALPTHVVVPTARVTAAVANPAAFNVGDVVRNVHTGEKFVVGPTGRDGCARFKGLGGARDFTPNALSNAHYVLVMAAAAPDPGAAAEAESDAATEPEPEAETRIAFAYHADGIALAGTFPAHMDDGAVYRFDDAMQAFLKAIPA